MYAALSVSFILHATLLGWALVSFKATPPLKIPEVVPVEVALITNEDLVRLQKGDRSAKKLETQKAKTTKKLKKTKKQAKKVKVRVIQQKTPPPSPPPKTPGPKKVKKTPPKPKTDPIAKKLAAFQQPKPKEAEPPKKKKTKPKTVTKKKTKKPAKRPKKKASFDELMKKAGLLDKRKPKSQDSGAADKSKKKLPKQARAGAQEGRDNRLSASEKSKLVLAIRRSIDDCWSIPGAAGGKDGIPVVALGWKLDRDGRVVGEPKVVNGGSGPFAGLAVAAAIRAVKQCEFNLPPKLYKYWSTIDRWDFRP